MALTADSLKQLNKTALLWYARKVKGLTLRSPGRLTKDEIIQMIVSSSEVV